MLSFAAGESPVVKKMVDNKEAEGGYERLSTNNKAFNATYPPLSKADVGFPGVQKDFHWDNTTDEPHKSRRKLILRKHPEIKELFGHCWRTKYSVLFLVSAQVFLALYLRDKMWTMEYWVSFHCLKIRYLILIGYILRFWSNDDTFPFFGHS
jgi:hypothetical protein